MTLSIKCDLWDGNWKLGLFSPSGQLPHSWPPGTMGGSLLFNPLLCMLLFLPSVSLGDRSLDITDASVVLQLCSLVEVVRRLALSCNKKKRGIFSQLAGKIKIIYFLNFKFSTFFLFLFTKIKKICLS